MSGARTGLFGPILLLAFIAASNAQQTCQNGVREGTEQCDDGNAFNGDGCSTTCQLEDPTGTVWKCVADMATLTSCCRALTNPVTSQTVCTCVGQSSDNPGYTITPDCAKRDIDECSSSGASVCHDNAVCQNLDATQSGQGMYNCVCPPGMLGDGVTRCDMFIYSSKLKVSVVGTLPGSFNTEAFIDNLYSWAVVPAYITRDRIHVAVSTFSTPVGGNRRGNPMRRMLQTEDENSTDSKDDSDSKDDYVDNSQPENRRRLLGRQRNVQTGANGQAVSSTGLISIRQTSGSLVTVTIDSNNEDQMANTTSSLNSNNIPTGGVYAVTQPPVSDISVSDTALAPVSTVLTGFMVDSIVYNSAQYQWVVGARYIHDAPDTITGLYVSRVGPAPYSTDTLNMFYVSQNPCIRSASVCCLNEFKDDYYVGSFGSAITSAIGTCDAGVQATQTAGMFNPANDQAYVDGIFNGFPDSSVVRLGDGSVQLLIAETDLRYNFSLRENLGPETPGFRLKFFVGMNYFTLLPANALSTTASQTQLEIVVTNTLTFSFATQQDYTFVKYITLSLYQNKWVDGIMERLMQFAKVGIVLPTGLTQNMATGLVPLGSIRFAIATSLPPMSDQAQWVNPCYSLVSNGMWDAGKPWKAMYASAASQRCAMQSSICTNPALAVLSSNLVEFYFPIGDGLVNPTHLAPGSGYKMYVYFDLSAVDSGGRNVITRLFAQAPLTSLSVSRSCESLQATLDLLSTSSVDLSIGLVGSSPEWDTSVYQYNNVRQVSVAGGILDVTNNTARSLESGLITLVVRGDPNVFSSSLTNSYFLEIEHLTTIHFLDATKFSTIKAMIAAGTGYSVIKDTTAGVLSIQLSQALSSACSAGGQSGALSCAVRHDIISRTVRNTWAVHPFATGVSTTDNTATRDWLTNNLLGVSEFSNGLAANMTSIVRSRFNIEDRIRRAWYIHPGHRWPTVPGSSAQSTLLLSDKLIAVAIVSLRDGSGTIVRRRLLTTTHETANRKLLQASSTSTTLMPVPRTNSDLVQSAMRAISNSPMTQPIPPIGYGVDVQKTLASIIGVDAQPYDVIRLNVAARFPVDWTNEQVNTAIAYRLRSNMPRYCPTCDGVFPVFYNIPRVPAGSLAVASGRRRRLLQSPESLAGMDDFHGTIDAMVSYTKSTGNEVLFSELFRSLIENAYATNTLKPGDSIDSFVDNVANGQVVLNSVAPTWNSGGTTYVVSEIFASKRVDGPIAIFDPNSPGAESANTTPPPTTTTPPPTTTPAPSNSTSRLTRADALEVKEIMTSPACQLRATKNSIDSFFFAIAFVMASMAI